MNVLTRRTTAGAAWLVASRLMTKGIDFVTLLALARFLSPQDFGLIALAISFVALIETVAEVPIDQVLIAQKKITKVHLDTAFTIGLIRGLSLSAIMMSIAAPVAVVYKDWRLFGLICALSLAPLFRSIGSAALSQYHQDLDYTKDVIIEVVAKTGSSLFAINIAYFYHSYWALAFSTITTACLSTFMSYILAPYRPRINLTAWRPFVAFFGWTTPAQIFSALNWQGDRLILGRLIPKEALGSFSIASDLSAFPEQAFVKTIIRPLMSAFSLIKGEKTRLKAAYLNSSLSVLTVGAPVMIGLSFLSEPIVRLVLGDQWSSVGPLLQWMSLILIPPLFTAPLGSLAMALEKPQTLLHLSATELVVKIPLVLGGALTFGVNGVVVARGLATVYMTVYSMVLVKRLIDLKYIDQIKSCWRLAISCILLGVSLIWTGHAIKDIAGIKLAFGILFCITLSYTFYVGSLLVLWHLAGRPPGPEKTALDSAVVLIRQVLRRSNRFGPSVL